MENDHTFDPMDETGMPNYYVGVMRREYETEETVNLYHDNNINLKGSHFLDCVSGKVHSDG